MLYKSLSRQKETHRKLAQKMAPIPSDDESSLSGSSASASDTEQITQANGAANMSLEDGEEEFHTEDSESSKDGTDAESDQGESDLDAGAIAPGVPLLPESLLKHIPQSAPPLKTLANVPWDQLTPKQKKDRRNNSRKTKKREYDRLQGEVKGTGVLEAGQAAQKKRGVAPVKKEKVRSGRVEKKGKTKAKAKAKMSGKQQMIEQRKRTVQMAAAGEMGGRGKRARTSKR